MEMLETEPDFDWTSGYPSRHLSFIFSQILPQRYILGDAVQTEINSINQNKILADQNENIIVDLCSGPFEGYIIPRHQHRFEETMHELSNYDTYIIHKQYSIDNGQNKENEAEIAANISYDMTTDTAVTKPGFLRVQVNNPKLKELSVRFQTKDYLSAEAVRKHTCDIIPNCDREKVIVALPCANWPEQSKKWQNRQRRSGWPDENTIQEVHKEMVMVVPSNCDGNSSIDTEWCYSFAKVQTKLFNKLNTFQRQCFALLKLLKRQSLIFPKILSDDHLKTMFLWICEKIPQDEWNFENLGTFFVYSIDYMLECIINKEIPHYFISQWNLLDGLDDDFQNDLMTTLANLRTCPIQPFYTYLSFFQFQHLPKKHLKLLFNDIEKQKAFDTHQTILQKQYKCLQLLTQEFIKEGKVQLALDIQDDIKMLLGKHDPCSFLSSISLQVSADKAIEIHEFLLKKFPNSPQKYLLLGNLGCMYHAKYATSEEPAKTSLMEKAAMTFREAISTVGASFATKTDFCNFLFDTKQYEETLVILSSDVIQEAEAAGKPAKEANSYGGDDQNTVDCNIQAVIAAYSGNVSLWSYAYMYYLKVQSFRMLDKTEDAISTLSDFSSACNKLHDLEKTDNQYKETAFLLLGFASKDVGQYTEAQTAFRHVEKMNQESAIAIENKDECTAILMSIDPDYTCEYDSDDQNARQVAKEPTATDKLKNLAVLENQDMEKIPSINQAHALLIENIPSINQAHALHRQYALLTQEREKAELKEQTQAQYKIALADKHAPTSTKMSYVNFLYQTGKYDQALGIIDEILTNESKKEGQDLEMICYTIEDIPIVDTNIETMMKSYGREIQLVVSTFAFYIMIKCLQQQGKTIQATQLLSSFKHECERTSTTLSINHKISGLSLLGCAAADLNEFDLAIEACEHILKLQPDNQMAKQNKDLCEVNKLSHKIIENETTGDDNGNEETDSVTPQDIPPLFGNVLHEFLDKKETPEKQKDFANFDLD